MTGFLRGAYAHGLEVVGKRCLKTELALIELQMGWHLGAPKTIFQNFTS